MTGPEQFQRLKEQVLLEYQKHFPYFQGNWKSFSAQDIQNLIALIEQNQKQSISEKWIYTHLKPEQNNKLPRKDMLDILSRFCGYSGWDEFTFEEKSSISAAQKKHRTKYIIGGLLLLALLLFILYPKQSQTQAIELKNEFTREKIDTSEVRIYQVKKGEKIPLKPKQQLEVSVAQGKNARIIIESPYYKKKEITLNPAAGKTEILVRPDDRAMMLKAFMLADIKDWETRKTQLNMILADSLEVIVMLKGNLGAEYFNKEEFSQKLILPTDAVKKMKIIELKSNAADKIEFIRIKQE